MTHRLGKHTATTGPWAGSGENYVLWGGREGYQSILNSTRTWRLKLGKLARFLSMVAEHKHRDQGRLPRPAAGAVLEPKPREPMAHQYRQSTSGIAGRCAISGHICAGH